MRVIAWEKIVDGSAIQGVASLPTRLQSLIRRDKIVFVLVLALLISIPVAVYSILLFDPHELSYSIEALVVGAVIGAVACWSILIYFYGRVTEVSRLSEEITSLEALHQLRQHELSHPEVRLYLDEVRQVGRRVLMAEKVAIEDLVIEKWNRDAIESNYAHFRRCAGEAAATGNSKDDDCLECMRLAAQVAQKAGRACYEKAALSVGARYRAAFGDLDNRVQMTWILQAAAASAGKFLQNAEEPVIARTKSRFAQFECAINVPRANAWFVSVRREAAYQVEQYRSLSHHKTPSDWYWLVSVLSGKLLMAQLAGDQGKAERYAISAAAALLNWFRSITET
ncbi:hypothetical protein N8I74_08180 [Chitiniphilus purpureus]|uniref:DUF4231 domain-containing protein n=1 Tax=Chitiniphilus purpureus TaxID=2981137 RepID=A0ABY6DRH6_9NEIS|nr:hypothetical protein [Chitiniphilus sp. CD1]UXY16974.1 hypothetical protein N8I74_08180 [Chitiniphilus sp. CD1]